MRLTQKRVRKMGSCLYKNLVTCLGIFHFCPDRRRGLGNTGSLFSNILPLPLDFGSLATASFRVEASCCLLPFELFQGLFIVCSFNRRYNLSHESGVVLPSGMDSFRGSNNISSVVPFQLLQVMCYVVARHRSAVPGERRAVTCSATVFGLNWVMRSCLSHSLGQGGREMPVLRSIPSVQGRVKLS